MAQLIVRRLDDAVLARLKERAARHGRSAEAEHREILRLALEGSARRRSFKEALAAMPAVGEDADFARPPARPRRVRL